MVKLLSFIFALVPILVFGAARTASVSGDWTNTATWGGSSFPVSGDSVDINGDIVVTIPAGVTSACATLIVGSTANSSGIATLTVNGVLNNDSGSSIRIGQGTGKDGKLIFGPDCIITNPTSLYLQNCYLQSTATRSHPAHVYGAGQVSTTGVTGPRQSIQISNVFFVTTGTAQKDFILENTTGTATSTLDLSNCGFIGGGAIRFASTDTPNTVSMSIRNSEFHDILGTHLVSLRRISGGTATYTLNHNVFQQSTNVAGPMEMAITTSGGCLVSGNYFVNTIGSEASIANTWTNNMWTIYSQNSSVIGLSDSGTGTTFDHNYIFSTKDLGANIHPVQTTGSGGSGTHMVTYNVLDSYSDPTNDLPDFFMANPTPLTTVVSYNLIIYSGEIVNGAHHPSFANPITIRNNTLAGTISTSVSVSGDIYRPEGAPNTGRILIRNNLHLGNNHSGEGSIIGSDSGAAQTIDTSQYNNFFTVASPYVNNTGGLTITNGNTTKTVPNVAAHETALDPQFIDPTRNMATWDATFGSGTGTRDSAALYFLGLNGYRDSPYYDEGGTVIPNEISTLWNWVRAGYLSANPLLHNTGDPSDGNPDIGIGSSIPAIYYVRTDGNDTNTGLTNTSGGAWLTIGRASTVIKSGDTIRVQNGTYNERVSVSASGSSGLWINYVADGQAVCRGFDIGGASYIRITGFEITHTNTDYTRAIKLNAVCSHIDIIDNYIHDVNGDGINSATYENGGRPSYITIRGNTFDYIGRVPNVITNASIAIGSSAISPHHWLVEYNLMSRCGDFIDVCGTNNIYRNNYCHDFRNSYFNITNASWHSDIFQDGSDGTEVGSRNHVYERNFCGDSIEADSHFGIWQDTVSAGDTNMVIRGNVGFNFGESGVGVKSTDKVATYNNTFYDLASAGGSGYGSAFVYYKSGSSSDYCSNGLVANSIISTTRDTNGSPIWFDPGATGIKTNNIGYATYFDSSFVSTNDPLFIDPTSPFRSFRVQPGSPAINSGTNVVWITSANSTGTTFNVNDGQLLIDGWGIVDGDAVTIGSTTTHVTSIVANSVTVASSVTWTNGQAVHWGSYITEDIGAFPYASSDLTWATILSNGSTYTVTPTGSARGVWFYVDGIPTNWVSSAPYSTTITNGTVTAKVYALYAQSVPVISASSPPQSQLGTFQFNGSATIIKGSFQ